MAKNNTSFLIDEKYGGIKLSVNELSDILTKIQYRSWTGVIDGAEFVGPGGVNFIWKNKRKVFTKLANGELILCFGLTGPNNGSDLTETLTQDVSFKMKMAN